VIRTPTGEIDIAALIPHSGSMCLLDHVVRYDETEIHCSTGSHRNAANPLAVGGRLDTICAVEYAAQAMALHGALTGPVAGRPTMGYLASLRDVDCDDDRLDLLEADLDITATRLHGEPGRFIYMFAVHCQGRKLLTGRAAVVLDAGGGGLRS
jgi:predicted hotdog family 3-hydroxylacyl-ACP dehydratase